MCFHTPAKSAVCMLCTFSVYKPMGVYFDWHPPDGDRDAHFCFWIDQLILSQNRVKKKKKALIGYLVISWCWVKMGMLWGGKKPSIGIQSWKLRSLNENRGGGKNPRKSIDWKCLKKGVFQWTTGRKEKGGKISDQPHCAFSGACG